MITLGNNQIPAMGRLLVNTLLALAAMGRGDHEHCLAMIGLTLELAEDTGIHAYELIAP